MDRATRKSLLVWRDPSKYGSSRMDFKEDSDDEWEIAYSNMTKQRKKKILT